MAKILSYKYYDSPEGQDIFLKSLATSKYAAVTGLIMGSYDVLMYTRPTGFVNTVARYAYFVGPLVGMATAFTVTANVTRNIRGKDDKLNYFLGGAMAGSIYSAWQRAPVLAVPAMVILGVAAMVKKTAIESGHTFFPDIPQMTKTAISTKNDWTMAKDIKELKTWTTGSS